MIPVSAHRWRRRRTAQEVTAYLLLRASRRFKPIWLILLVVLSLLRLVSEHQAKPRVFGVSLMAGHHCIKKLILKNDTSITAGDGICLDP